MRQTNGRVSFLADFDTVQFLIKGHISDWDGIVQPVGSIGVIANPLTGERCSPPWGQMSYWGAQVIISLFGAIPVIGDDLTLFDIC